MKSFNFHFACTALAGQIAASLDTGHRGLAAERIASLSDTAPAAASRQTRAFSMASVVA